MEAQELKKDILKALGFTDDCSYDEIIDVVLNYRFRDFYQHIFKIALGFNNVISTENKLRVAFYLNSVEEMKSYVALNEEEFNRYLEKIVLLDLGGITEEEHAKLLASTGRTFLCVPFRNKALVDFFAQHFLDKLFYPSLDLSVIENNNIFQFMSKDMLLRLLKDKNCPIYEIVAYAYLQSIQNYGKDVLNYLVDIYLELIKRQRKIAYSLFMKVELNNRFSFKINLDNLGDIYSDYFFYLNYLRYLTQKEARKLPLYQKVYNIFYEEFLRRYEGRLGDNEKYMVEKLFWRVVKGESLFLVWQIDNEKTLYHFYKTNEFIALADFENTLEEIKGYNAKQYLKLKQEVLKMVLDDSFYYHWGKKFNATFLNIFIVYGFTFLSKIKDYFLVVYAVLIQELDAVKKDERYKEEFCDLVDFFALFKAYDLLNRELEEMKKDPIYKRNLKSLVPFFLSLKENREMAINIFKEAFKANKKVKSSFYISAEYILKVINDAIIFMLPNNEIIAPNLKRLELIKKGDVLNEKYQALALYNRYRNRRYSSIPDINGCLDNINFEMVDMHDVGILTNGIDRYILPKGINVSCLTPGGKAATALRHGAINEHGRFFKVFQGDTLIAYSWVWRAGDVLCFDNIEVTDAILNIETSEDILYKIYFEAAKMLVLFTNEQEDRGIQWVVVGRTDKDVKISKINNLEDTTQYGYAPFRPNSKEELYLEDSKNRQLILYRKCDTLNTLDVKPIYERKRDEVISFEMLSKEVLQKLKSIYFDYCLEHCLKDDKCFTYIKGFIGQDWFLGINQDGSQDFCHYGTDERYLDEVKSLEIKIGVPSIIQGTKEEMDRIINGRVEANDGYFEYLRTLNDKVLLPDNFYFHSVGHGCGIKAIKALQSILCDGEIGSFYSRNEPYGKLSTSNGYYFICVTHSKDKLYLSLKDSTSCVLKENILTFRTDENLFKGMIIDDMYPYPRNGGAGEYQVFGRIPIDKFLAIRLLLQSDDDFLEVAKVVNLMDLLGMDIPLMDVNDMEIDKGYIRQLTKIS